MPYYPRYDAIYDRHALSDDSTRAYSPVQEVSLSFLNQLAEALVGCTVEGWPILSTSTTVCPRLRESWGVTAALVFDEQPDRCPICLSHQTAHGTAMYPVTLQDDGLLLEHVQSKFAGPNGRWFIGRYRGDSFSSFQVEADPQRLEVIQKLFDWSG
jgi:hypothetical protein